MNPESILKECTLPAMPHVAAKIMSLVNDPAAKVEDVQVVISADQALTSRVIKVSGSVFHTGGRKVETISDAVVVLGFEALKNIAIAIATKDIYKGSGNIGEKLWEHAIGVSIAAGIIGKTQRAFKINTEKCIVGGLLHDIGKAVMNQNQPNKYIEVVNFVTKNRVSFSKVEKEIFGFTHQEVGALLFREWKFSPELTEMVSNHHSCNLIKNNDKSMGLCYIVSFADCICQVMGVGYLTQLPELCTQKQEMMKTLDIKPTDMGAMLEEFQQKFIEEKLSFMG
jgi:putative nucleotidyltransferase with HDIG domain